MGVCKATNVRKRPILSHFISSFSKSPGLTFKLKLGAEVETSEGSVYFQDEQPALGWPRKVT